MLSVFSCSLCVVSIVTYNSGSISVLSTRKSAQNKHASSMAQYFFSTHRLVKVAVWHVLLFLLLLRLEVLVHSLLHPKILSCVQACV